MSPAPFDIDLASLARPRTLRATRTDAGGETVVKLEGMLDALSVADAAPLLDALPGKADAVVRLDLSSLRLIDGRGVAAIVSLSKRMREGGGRLHLSGLKEQPLVVLRLMRLDGLLGG